MKYVNYENLETAKEMIKVALDKKVDKEDGKGLSTNDYTNEEKNKLAGIEEEANKTIVDSELSLESTNPVQNKIVSEELNTKANKVEVEEALDTKADKITVEAELETKANKIEVEEALETKADKVTVEESLATKVNKEPGKGLSTNDFTDEEKEKLSKLDEKSNENVIEVVEQNGKVLPIIDKSVNIVTITEDEIDNKIEEAIKEVDLTPYAKLSDVPTEVSQLTNDKGYITSYTETDPTVPAHVKSITEEDIEKWNSGGGGDGPCNVTVSPSTPSNGEAIWIKEGKNLCKTTDITTGRSFGQSGFIQSDYSNIGITDYIEIEPNTVYTLSGITYNQTSLYHVWYSDAKIKITAFPRFSNTVQSQSYTSPFNAKYVRFTLFLGTDSTQDERTTFQFEKGSVATPYTPYAGEGDIYVKNANGDYDQFYDRFPVPDMPSSYVLPAATANTLGGIKVGNNLTVDADGTLHAQAGGGDIVIEGGSTALEVYSTEETLVGVYKDKPLYRKVFEYGALHNTQGALYKDHGIQDIEEITSIDATIYENNMWVHIPMVGNAWMYNGVSYACRVSKTQVGIYVSEDKSMQTAKVIIEYTKTTDNKGVVVEPNEVVFVEETDPTVPDHVKAITEEDIEKWNSGTGGSGGIIEGDTVPINAIFDYEGDTVPEGYIEVEPSTDDGGSSSEVYSTEETVIGTWLGKPLYRKVCSFGVPTFSNNLAEWKTDISNCDVMITQKLFWYDSATRAWRFMPGNYHASNDWDSQNIFIPETGSIRIEVGASALTRIKEKATSIYAIFEYTKTTD